MSEPEIQVDLCEVVKIMFCVFIGCKFVESLIAFYRKAVEQEQSFTCEKPTSQEEHKMMRNMQERGQEQRMKISTSCHLGEQGCKHRGDMDEAGGNSDSDRTGDSQVNCDLKECEKQKDEQIEDKEDADCADIRQQNQQIDHLKDKSVLVC